MGVGRSFRPHVPRCWGKVIKTAGFTPAVLWCGCRVRPRAVASLRPPHSRPRSTSPMSRLLLALPLTVAVALGLALSPDGAKHASAQPRKKVTPAEEAAAQAVLADK